MPNRCRRTQIQQPRSLLNAGCASLRSALSSSLYYSPCAVSTRARAKVPKTGHAVARLGLGQDSLLAIQITHHDPHPQETPPSGIGRDRFLLLTAGARQPVSAHCQSHRTLSFLDCKCASISMGIGKNHWLGRLNSKEPLSEHYGPSQELSPASVNLCTVVDMTLLTRH